jgi:hypothetical protein
VFCQSSDFKVPYHDYIPKDGEVIECANCGKLNDVTSLQKVAIEDATKKISNQMQKYMKNLFKK